MLKICLKQQYDINSNFDTTIKFLELVQTSAKTGEYVEDMFETAIRSAIDSFRNKIRIKGTGVRLKPSSDDEDEQDQRPTKRKRNCC